MQNGAQPWGGGGGRERRSMIRAELISKTGIAIFAGLCLGSFFAVIVATSSHDHEQDRTTT
ncbi:hypothetical protein COCSUDRAFT_60345 [Coccomyxa subellipsoidea C-169]|uniref:Uncharacterized protein n=1 Tax=Coccomyxa subellipsoidea (strain C-169) TaxID=574566 RepID=I0YJ11_COCSC|nr:hypothetical protein COCSUDRAFT_60345 [Coccomyxa subellipsoidea C-169]EIE18380.1 hypothetical protein COCSUDRAFT_60345 [Coccomyxa subellipsoidea C-169]|eukprot:XP_005642924.1 hypothetical protein COCSUDRAFT_60345 [Coccomyxa subellipsoidea C-169]